MLDLPGRYLPPQEKQRQSFRGMRSPLQLNAGSSLEQACFKFIQSQERENGSYLFEVSGNGKKLFHAFGNLLANSRQRLAQDQIQMNY